MIIVSKKLKDFTTSEKRTKNIQLLVRLEFSTYRAKRIGKMAVDFAIWLDPFYSKRQTEHIIKTDQKKQPLFGFFLQ